MPLPNRDEAWQIVCEWMQSDSLRKHVLAVEAAVRAYARRFGEDEEFWGVTALLHDLDFERYPDMEAISAATDELYGASISPFIRQKGESQCVSLRGSFIDDNTLSVHISRLREKIGAEHIVTVRGVGYRWEDGNE